MTITRANKTCLRQNYKKRHCEIQLPGDVAPGIFESLHYSIFPPSCTLSFHVAFLTFYMDLSSLLFVLNVSSTCSLFYFSVHKKNIKIQIMDRGSLHYIFLFSSFLDSSVYCTVFSHLLKTKIFSLSTT